MPGAIMEKVWGLLGIDTAEEIDEEEVENYEEEVETEQEERRPWGRRNTKVVNMPQVQQVKMVISQPTTFEQAANICDLLKQKKISYR